MTTTRAPVLPLEFSDLEPFAAWSIQTDHDRYQRRLASSMTEMQAFYEATVPRARDAFAYLDQFELDELSESGLRLLWLLFSVGTVSFAVDIWKQPKVPDSGSAYVKFVREPSP
jgi:hypothetical protein